MGYGVLVGLSVCGGGRRFDREARRSVALLAVQGSAGRERRSAERPITRLGDRR